MTDSQHGDTDIDPSSEPGAAVSTDRTLLRKLETGDDDAATALYQRYAIRLMSLIRKRTSGEFTRRFDAEDVMQSVFRTFFRRAREGGYSVPASGELWQLLLVLSLNKICDLAVHHRAQKRDVRISKSTLPGFGENSKDDGGLALSILKMTIDESLDELMPVQREIILDRINGFEVAEIAERVGRSKRTVERSLQRFRQRLSTVIRDD